MSFRELTMIDVREVLRRWQTGQPIYEHDWVLEADIRAFYDAIDHGWMQKLLEHRIGNRRLLRLLMKWLRAGVVVGRGVGGGSAGA